MSGTVFNIGVTDCGMTMATLVRHHPDSVIGTFWLPATPGEQDKLGHFWVDYVLEENQAQAILDDIDDLEQTPGLRTVMVILLTGHPQNPGDYSFMAGITRLFEGKFLLEELAKYNIPAHTECSFPEIFYADDAEDATYRLWKSLSLNDWEEYIRRTLVSIHGKKMLEDWWERLSKAT